MTKKISELEKNAIRLFVSENPEITMNKARLHFNLTKKVFSRVVKKDLQLWKPKLPLYQITEWSPKIKQQIQEIVATQPTRIMNAYRLFLSNYQGKRKIHLSTFRSFLEVNDLLLKTKRPLRFLKTDFTRILKDWSMEPKEKQPIGRIIRFSFFEYLKQISLQPLLVDTSLTEEHRFRYQTIGGKACWCCGKHSYFNVPVLLDIDHISGKSSNHCFANLRLLCGGCHSITRTRNRGYNKSTEEVSLYSHFLLQTNLSLMKEEFEKNIKS